MSAYFPVTGKVFNVADYPGYAYVLLSFAVTGVAPHAVTVRASYTVPAGKRAFIAKLNCQVIRRTAATTVSDYHTMLLDAASSFCIIDAGSNSNVVGGLGTNSPMLFDTIVAYPAGTVIEFVTYDNSTAGTVDYRGSCEIAEVNV